MIQTKILHPSNAGNGKRFITPTEALNTHTPYITEANPYFVSSAKAEIAVTVPPNVSLTFAPPENNEPIETNINDITSQQNSKALAIALKKPS